MTTLEDVNRVWKDKEQLYMELNNNDIQEDILYFRGLFERAGFKYDYNKSEWVRGW